MKKPAKPEIAARAPSRPAKAVTAPRKASTPAEPETPPQPAPEPQGEAIPPAREIKVGAKVILHTRNYVLGSTANLGEVRKIMPDGKLLVSVEGHKPDIAGVLSVPSEFDPWWEWPA